MTPRRLEELKYLATSNVPIEVPLRNSELLDLIFMAERYYAMIGPADKVMLYATQLRDATHVH